MQKTLSMIPGPVAYNLPQKKSNFQKLAFLLEKSVGWGHSNSELPLAVIPEQGACPLRPKGARSKAKNKKGARSRNRVILEQGA